MKLYKNPSVNELEKIVKNGNLSDATILHYTGHVFGIGCLIGNRDGMQRISSLKKRNDKSGFICLISDYGWLAENGIEVPVSLEPLLIQYWPGNLTVVMPCHEERFAHLAINGKVAFRVPPDPLLRSFLHLVQEPMVSTSINISGLQPVNDLDEIQKRYGDWFDIGVIPVQKYINPQLELSTIIEYNGENTHNNSNSQIKCLREGSIPYYEIRNSFKKPSILFICTGNICRSPIAEYLFNYYAEKGNLPFVSTSAGLLENGAMISFNSLQLLVEKGISAYEHLSRKADPQIMSTHWLILTMEQRQRDFLQSTFPNAAHRIFTLKEYVGEEGDISDPIGLDLDSYREIFNQIDDVIQKLLSLLKKYERL